MSPYRKQLAKIYNRIMQIVTSCVDNYIEYYNYIDDLLDNNQYPALKDVFSICFKTNITKYNSIKLLKRETYKIAKTFTNTYFQINLKGFYDANNVYQMGYNIYDTISGNPIGQLVESYRTEEVSVNGVTYSYLPNQIYYRNTCLFHKLDEPKAIVLTVVIGDSSYNNRVVLNDPTMLLLDKYKLGISLLIKGEVNLYVNIDYAMKYFL